MSYFILNDVHLGLRRKSGATPLSLRDYQILQINLLNKVVSEVNESASNLIINGDLLDSWQVSYELIWAAISALSVVKGRLICCRGNHDLSRDQTKMSAFDMVCLLIPKAEAISSPFFLTENCAIVPSLINQVAFDSAIAEVVAKGATTLLAHCNFNNPFTEGKDHSLNLTPEQVAKFDHVILGHEHQKRDLPGIDILGAPLPCSISECSKAKGYHRWEGPGHEVEFIESWNTETGYAEIDWHDLHGVTATADFVRVVGTGEPEEAATVIQEVARFRENCSAFFISNSVKIGDIDLSIIEEAAETDLHAFNPRAELLLALPEQYQEKMRRFLS